MLIKIAHFCDSTLSGFNHENHSHKSKILLQNSDKRNMVVAVFNSKDKLGFQPLRSHTRLQNHGKDRRKIIVHSVDPGASPSGPPSNILSWAIGVAVAVVIPFISYKWGPLLKSKVMGALQMAEDVVEAVEHVAEKVEKVAEDIADDIPKGTKLREVVDFVEKIAERAADDAGHLDDFIDKVQEEEEKAEAFAKSLEEEFKKPQEDTKEEKPNVGN